MALGSFVMSLEGPAQNARLAQLRGQLYSALPREWWLASSSLQGLFTPYRLSWPFALGMLILGGWLGGSARGRKIVACVKGR